MLYGYLIRYKKEFKEKRKMELVTRIAEVAATMIIAFVLPMLFKLMSTVHKFQESEVVKQNEQLKELIKIREEKIQELEIRLDEYRSSENE